MILSGVIVVSRAREHGKCRLTKKQILMSLIFTGSLLFTSYALDRDVDPLYLAQYYVYYQILLFQIYYFAMKAVKGSNQQLIRTKQSIRLIAILFFVFFTFELVISSVEIKQNKDFRACHEKKFDVLRIIVFLMQTIFCIVGRVLQKRFYSDALYAQFGLSNSQQLMIRKKQKSQVQQLWYLIVLNFLGAFLLFLQNIYQMLEKGDSYRIGTQCRIIPNDTQIQWKDDLNSALFMVLIAMSNQIPQILALKIFWVPKNKKEKSVESVYFINPNYNGLTIRRSIQSKLDSKDTYDDQMSE